MATTTTEVKPVAGFEGHCEIDGARGRFTDLQYTPMTYTMIDVTNTEGGGKKEYFKGCYEESISGTLLLDSSTAYATIKAACQNRDAVTCTFYIGDTAEVTGLMHPNFTGAATFSPDDRVTVPFECRPAITETTTT